MAWVVIIMDNILLKTAVDYVILLLNWDTASYRYIIFFTPVFTRYAILIIFTKHKPFALEKLASAKLLVYKGGKNSVKESFGWDSFLCDIKLQFIFIYHSGNLLDSYLKKITQ